MSAVLSQPVRDQELQLGPCPRLETPRLVLRAHTLDDADGILAALSDFEVARMLSRVPSPFDRRDALEWLLRQTARRELGWAFAITNRENNYLGCVELSLNHGQWGLIYWLNRSAWGQGIASQAVKAAIAAFDEVAPGVEIVSGFFADNAASMRLQTRLGFEIIGCSDVFSLARGGMVAHLQTRRPARFNL